jgi:predicted ATPase
VYIDWAGRGFDRQSYTLLQEPSPSLASGEEVFTTFAYRRELEEKVSAWLTKITGTGVTMHIVPGRQVQLKNSEGFDIYQGGFGTNQLIRPLLMLAASPYDSLIAIEEAETSLHPRAQVKLCDVLVDIAREENKQIVLTTHNEHMLTGFLNIVAENRLASDELRVYFFTKARNEARVTSLKVDDRGGVEGGLRGFFEVDMENYERHLKALSRRAKQ